MNREILSNKIWYRAIKVLFVMLFIATEIIGLFLAHSVASQNKSPLTLTDLIYAGITLRNLSTGVDIPNNDSDSQVHLSLVTNMVLSGIKPTDSYRESVGKLPISDANFQNLKSNIEKMLRAGVKNQGINYYTDWAFGQFDQEKNIQPLPDSPNLHKYPVIQQIGIYSIVFLIVLVFFWLLSRVFFYVVIGEKFLRIGQKQ